MLSLSLFKVKRSFKNNIPSSDSDKGAGGYGIVFFEVVTTIPFRRGERQLSTEPGEAWRTMEYRND